MLNVVTVSKQLNYIYYTNQVVHVTIWIYAVLQNKQIFDANGMFYQAKS